MPVVKKRNEQTQTRLLLESSEAVELPAAELDERNVVVQFDQFKQFIPELIETLRAGTEADPVAVMNDGSTFAVHTATRTFWIKIWHHANSELAKIERVQVISCLPSTRGVRIIADGMNEDDDEYEDYDEDDDTDDDRDVSGESASVETFADEAANVPRDDR